MYIVKFEEEIGKVTVSGDVEPERLIRTLNKHGKRAEINGDPGENNGVQVEDGVGEKKKKERGRKGNNCNLPPQPKGGNLPPPAKLSPQQMKALQDLMTKLPPQIPVDADGAQVPIPKSVMFDLPGNDDVSSDDTDGDFNEEYEDEGGMEDVPPVNKTNQPPPPPPPLIVGNGDGAQIPNLVNFGNVGQHQQVMKGCSSGYTGAGAQIPQMVNAGQHPQFVMGGKNGGAPPQDCNFGDGGGVTGPVHQNYNAINAQGGAAIGGGARISMITDRAGHVTTPNRVAVKAAPGGNVGPTRGMPVGQRGTQVGQILNFTTGQIPTAQDLPGTAVHVGCAGGGAAVHAGYFPEAPTRIPLHPQQPQQVMYSRPPPAVGYFPPSPFYASYPNPPLYPPPQYNYYSDDEDTTVCSVM